MIKTYPRRIVRKIIRFCMVAVDPYDLETIRRNSSVTKHLQREWVEV